MISFHFEEAKTKLRDVGELIQGHTAARWRYLKNNSLLFNLVTQPDASWGTLVKLKPLSLSLPRRRGERKKRFRTGAKKDGATQFSTEWKQITKDYERNLIKAMR